MSDVIEVAAREVDELYERLDREAEEAGYHLNPDVEFVKELLKGMLVNQKRFGYMACPCRLASGDRADDLDIICPCDYRDPDLDEYGACYCALYVTAAIKAGESGAEAIADRRPPDPAQRKSGAWAGASDLAHPVFRCKVCGYLCARNEPPGACPICKVDRDRFERFM